MSMATGGSSSHITLKKIKYDVFISFRGEDTRSNFTSHLHSALSRKKIKAFIDENDLKTGDEISPTLLKAIEESKLCLIILSEDYASSRWCLEELMYILQCKKTDGQSEVLPVFYNVEPSDVRKQEGSYAESFAELIKKGFGDEKLQVWRDALRKIAYLSGWTSKSFRSEAKLVDTIVDAVIKKLKDISTPRDDLKGLVGVLTRIETIEWLLHIGSLNVGPVGIWGIGGIGKTTLARAVFNRLSSQFEACSFLENVREQLLGADRLNLLKNKLFSELMEGESFLPYTKDRLREKRVLVVFDDVDDAELVEQLVGDWFGPESRIIVTSRDQQVLRNIGVSRTFEVNGLKDVEALELFSLHAFKSNYPTSNKEDLSKRVVKYAGGIPLALIVLGRHLFSKSIEEWESTLGKLEKIPDKKILSVLKISYDALDDTEKDIFLDIACFYKGEERNLVQKILDACDLFATAGITVLVDKALITICEYSNTIWMHDLIKMMAFEIVSPRFTNQDPRRGSRLWTADDIYHALKDDRGIETITGISLDTSNFNREISLLPDTFSKMPELRLLKITDTGKLYLPQGQVPLIFPDALTDVQWHRYPLKSLSTNFTAEMLVRLDMRGSQLEKLWEGVQHLDKLKSIDLTGSMKLTQVPDLSLAPNIESVNLMFCASLIEVPSCFQHLNKLKKLELIGCASLCKLSGLPKNLITLKVLPIPVKRLSRFSCCNRHLWCLAPEFPSKLERFPEISHSMECIETLTLDYSAIKELPFSIKNLTRLKRLSMNYCENLEFLPDIFHCLSSLQDLRLTWCRKLESLPRLPLFLSCINVICCTSLKKVLSSVDLVNQNWDDFFNRDGWDGERDEINFFGCDMLDENARQVINEDARFRLLRYATLYWEKVPCEDGVYCWDDYFDEVIEEYYVYILWPESKIPWWFSHKSEESSISINLPHPDQWYNNSYLGLAACVILEFKDITSLWRDHGNLSLRCDSVYMFPNGDSWRQRRSTKLPIPYLEGILLFCGCCSKISQTVKDLDYHSQHHQMTNCQHVFMLVYPAYGRFLAFKADQGTCVNRYYHNWKPREYPGEYVKADQGSSDFDENEKSGFDPTATASFSFYLDGGSYDVNHIAKVVKCGVHLLHTHEIERFKCNQESESRGREVIYFESNQEEGEEPLPKRIRV